MVRHRASIYELKSYTEKPLPKDAGGETELVFHGRLRAGGGLQSLLLHGVGLRKLIFALNERCPALHGGEIIGEFDARDRDVLEKCRSLPLALHGAPLGPTLDRFFYGPRELSQEERYYLERPERVAAFARAGLSHFVPVRLAR